MLRPGRRARRQARRPAQLHALGQADPDRLRRLPGDEPVQAAQDHRRGRHLPVAHRRRRRTCSRPSAPIEIQCLLGADIQMQLDECVALPATPEEIERGDASARCAGPSAASARLRDAASGAGKPGPGAVRHRAGRHRCRSCGARSAEALVGDGFAGLRRRRPGRRRTAGSDAGDAGGDARRGCRRTSRAI